MGKYVISVFSGNKNNQYWLFLVVLVCILFKDSCQTSWSSVNVGNCEYTTNKGFSIESADHAQLFIASFKASEVLDVVQCRDKCCKHNVCNGYLWKPSNPAYNCQLLKCSSEGTNCKDALKRTSSEELGEIGFITGYKKTTERDVDSSMESRVSTDTKAKVTDTKTESSANDVSKASGASGMSVHFFDTAKKSSSNMVMLASESKSQVVSDLKVSGNTTKDNTTKQVNVSKSTNEAEPLNEHRNHTNTLSLCAALFFGIGFMITILVMMGRRWAEVFQEAHQKGYKRLSYLLNGV